MRGPYRHGAGWRFAIIRDGQKTLGEVFEAEEDAPRIRRLLERQIERENSEKLSKVLEDYEKYMVKKGNKPVSVKTAIDWLRVFFGDAVDESVLALTPTKAKALAKALDDRKTQRGTAYSVAGRRNSLNAAKTFGRWLVREGKLKANPFEPFQVLGRINKGKEQLRINEARKWLSTAEAQAALGDVGAVAAMGTFPLGLRSGEVAARTVRDLDDDGQFLWIDSGKTDKARRRVVIPLRTRPHLLRLAGNRAPHEPLFPGIDRHAVRRNVKRICRLAGVPVVCAHAMRGLLATLAVEGGAVLAEVADGLGHTSPTVTLNHYAVPGSARTGQVTRSMAVIDKAGSPPDSGSNSDPSRCEGGGEGR